MPTATEQMSLSQASKAINEQRNILVGNLNQLSEIADNLLPSPKDSGILNAGQKQQPTVQAGLVGEFVNEYYCLQEQNVFLNQLIQKLSSLI